MRYPFDEIFRENLDGTLTPVRRIRVGGVSFGPEITFGQGAAFGGINFYDYKGHVFEADNQKDILVITGIY